VLLNQSALKVNLAHHSAAAGAQLEAMLQFIVLLSRTPSIPDELCHFDRDCAANDRAENRAGEAKNGRGHAQELKEPPVPGGLIVVQFTQTQRRERCGNHKSERSTHRYTVREPGICHLGE
jgi:hypothetical protein